MNAAEQTEVAEIPAVQDTQGRVIPFTNDGALSIVARMVSSGIPKESIDQMVALIEWDDARKAKMAFNAAFALAKGKFKQAKKSGHNLHLKAKYSLLEDYDDASRDALSEHGLSWRHVPRMEGNNLCVRCILAHQAGHTEEAELSADAHSMVNNAVNKLQSEGIVLMYLKRMTLSSMLGLVSDSEFDNDGNGGKEAERIDQKQLADMKALIEEVKANVPAFLKYLKVEKLEDLSKRAYPDAIKMLEAKRK
jgi:hypothetical protein